MSKRTQLHLCEAKGKRLVIALDVSEYKETKVEKYLGSLEERNGRWVRPVYERVYFKKKAYCKRCGQWRYSQGYYTRETGEFVEASQREVSDELMFRIIRTLGR